MSCRSMMEPGKIPGQRAENSRVNSPQDATLFRSLVPSEPSCSTGEGRGYRTVVASPSGVGGGRRIIAAETLCTNQSSALSSPQKRRKQPEEEEQEGATHISSSTALLSPSTSNKTVFFKLYKSQDFVFSSFDRRSPAANQRPGQHPGGTLSITSELEAGI